MASDCAVPLQHHNIFALVGPLKALICYISLNTLSSPGISLLLDTFIVSVLVIISIIFQSWFYCE